MVNEKVGLDDFIVANAGEALSAFDRLPRYRLADIEQLEDMLKRWAFIKEPVGYLERATLKLRSVSHFQETCANRAAAILAPCRGSLPYFVFVTPPSIVRAELIIESRPPK